MMPTLYIKVYILGIIISCSFEIYDIIKGTDSKILNDAFKDAPISTTIAYIIGRLIWPVTLPFQLFRFNK